MTRCEKIGKGKADAKRFIEDLSSIKTEIMYKIIFTHGHYRIELREPGKTGCFYSANMGGKNIKTEAFVKEVARLLYMHNIFYTK